MLGWSAETHEEITGIALRSIQLSDEEKDEILKGEQIPDIYLPLNMEDHFQTPGFGRAIDKIMESYKKGDLYHLGQAIHFLQDICNPFHTTLLYQAMHPKYENYSDRVPITLDEQDSILLFHKDMFRESLEWIVRHSNGYLETIVKGYQTNNMLETYGATMHLKNLAVSATHQLIVLWLGKVYR
jgi:hypothetical protein